MSAVLPSPAPVLALTSAVFRLGVTLIRAESTVLSERGVGFVVAVVEIAFADFFGGEV